MFLTCIVLRNIIYICSVPITVTDKFRTTFHCLDSSNSRRSNVSIDVQILINTFFCILCWGLNLLVLPLPMVFWEAEISTVAVTLAEDYLFAALSYLLPLPLLILGDIGKSKSKFPVLSGSIAHWNTSLCACKCFKLWNYVHVSVFIHRPTWLVILVVDTCGLLCMEFTLFGVLPAIAVTVTISHTGFCWL